MATCSSRPFYSCCCCVQCPVALILAASGQPRCCSYSDICHTSSWQEESPWLLNHRSGHPYTTVRPHFKFVLVWDTATGKGTCQLKLDLADEIRPRAVAISNSGDWILCAGFVEGDSAHAFIHLWGPSYQGFVGRFDCSSREWGQWAVTFISEDRLHGAIVGGEGNVQVKHTHGRSQAQIVTATTTTDDVEY
jgi:hypothetical protein